MWLPTAGVPWHVSFAGCRCPVCCVRRYCPAGSFTPLLVDVGFYSAPDAVTDDPTAREDEAECVPGQYCTDGVRRVCDAGRYSRAYGQTTCDVCPIGTPSMHSTACRRRCLRCRPRGGVALRQSLDALISLFRVSISRSRCLSSIDRSIKLSFRLWCRRSHAVVYLPMRPGHVCPNGTGALSDANLCNRPTGYCPLGSAVIDPTPVGYYAIETAVGSGLYYNVSLCEPGHVCVAGGRSACPSGRFGGGWGNINGSCDGPCAAGYYCSAGSLVATAAPCSRDANLYCPQVCCRCLVCSGGSAFLFEGSWRVRGRSE